MHSLEYVLNQKKFYRENSIYFDLTDDVEIVFVRFITGLEAPGANILEKTELMAKNQKVGFVVIHGSNSNHEYRGNLDGIPGFDLWFDASFIGTFLNELLFIRNKVKYVIGFGNCSSAWTTLISSIKCRYSSMVLFTPVISQAPGAMYVSSLVQSVTDWRPRLNIINKANGFASQLDQFDTLMFNINNGVPITMYWPTVPTKTDQLEKDRVLAIPNKRNLKVVECDMPLDMNPHNLLGYLRDTSEIKAIISQEIALARMSINSKSLA